MSRFLFSFYLLFGILISVTGQITSPYSINYDVEDGINSSMVYTCFQDSKGTLWFGTNEGVSVFDGENFTQYSIESGIADKEIFQIKEDKNGRIWFLTLNGKLSYYYQNKIYNEYNDSLLHQISFTSLVSSFDSQNEESLYMGSLRDGVYLINKYQNTFKVIKKEPYIQYFNFWKNQDKLFFLSFKGIYEHIDGVSKLEYEIHNPKNTYVRSFINQKKEIYLGFNNEIIKLDESLNKVYTHKLNIEEDIITIGEVFDYIYVGTRKGVYFFNERNNRLFLDKKLLDELSVSNVIMDNEKGLWFSTLQKGVFYIPYYELESYHIDSYLANDQINSFLIDEDKIYVGTSKSILLIFNKNEIKTQNFKSVKEAEINKIKQTDSCYKWILSKSFIAKYDNNSIIQFPFWANDILFDKENFYVASNSFYVFDKNDKSKVFSSLDSFPYELFKKNEKLRARCYQLEDYKDNIWIASTDGLMYYSKISDSIVKCGSIHKQLENTISNITIDSISQTLIVTPLTGGLYLIDLSSNKLKEILLQGKIIRSVKGKNGEFYIATDSDVKLLKIKSNSTKLYNTGLSLGIFNQKIIDIEYANNNLYLLFDNGVFEIKSIKKIQDMSSPLLRLNSVKFGDSILLKPNNFFLIPYNSNKITFDFKGQYFKSPKNLTYKYKLNQENWEETSTGNINFSHLTPGNYTFEVLCLSKDGKASKALKYSFVILAPFWRKGWFVAFTILLLIILIFFSMRFRLKKIEQKFLFQQKIMKTEKENLELEKLVLQSEQKVRGLQMNPHFIFNSLNTMKGLYLENKLNEADCFVAKFSKLLREILACNTQFVSLDKEIYMLELYFQLLNIRHNGIFSYKITNKVKEKEVLIPPLLIQPFVENAFIHGVSPAGEGEISVLIEQKNKQLEIKVENDGIKYQPKLDKKIHSTQITQERLAILEKQTNIKTYFNIDILNKEKQKGTQVTIKIPYLKEYS